MNIIVAMDENRAIGYLGNLLVTIPEDHRFFREKTTGNVVVMGRKTLESLPEKRPLPNRVNIILSRNQSYQVDDAIIVHSIEECKELLKKYSSDSVYIIGGESIYEAFLLETNEMYLTKIHHTFQADAYFPDFKQDKSWVLIDESKVKNYKGITYSFLRYRRL